MKRHKDVTISVPTEKGKTMNDLISRKALLAEYDRVHIGEPGKARKLIEDAPTVDAVEVVHGRWIPIIDEPTPLRKMPMLSGYKCSVCGRYEEEEEPYCNCGAKMDGDGNGSA